MTGARRVVTAGFAALFVFAAALQHNDPDPLGWIAIYLAAAVACLGTVVGRPVWWWSAATAAIALGWAASLAPTGVTVPPGSLFAHWEMQDERVEIAREMYGLLIVFAACALLARAQWRRRPPLSN